MHQICGVPNHHLFPSSIRRHTFLTENWLLTHDSVVSFQRVFVLNTIIVCCDIDIPFNPLNRKKKKKNIFLDDRGGSSCIINRGSTGPPGYQVQLLGILMD